MEEAWLCGPYIPYALRIYIPIYCLCHILPCVYASGVMRFAVWRGRFFFIFSFFQVDHQPLSEASLTLVAPCSFVFVMERTWLERTIWGLRIEEPALWKRNWRCVCFRARIFRVPFQLSYFRRTTPFSGSGISSKQRCSWSRPHWLTERGDRGILWFLVQLWQLESFEWPDKSMSAATGMTISLVLRSRLTLFAVASPWW